MPAAGSPPARRLLSGHPYLLLVLANLFWAGNFVLARAVRGRVPPIALSFWRWVGALALLLLLTSRSLRAQWPLLRREWKLILAGGILGIGNFNTFVYLGVGETTATNAVLLNSVCPALIVGITFAAGLGRATLRQVLGIAVSLLGVVTIVAQGSPAAVRSLAFNRGDLWVLAAVVSWAFYTVIVVRRPEGVAALTLLAAMVAVGVAWIAPLYAWELSRGARLHLDAVTVGSLAYVAVFPSVIAYLFWNQGVEVIGPNRAGVFIHLLPAFGAVLAALLLGESFRLFHLIGIGLILAGVALASAARPGGKAAER